MPVFSTDFDSDTLETSQGPVVMTFIGHGTLMFAFDSQVIHIDPVSRYADYSTLPNADLILITHHHGDHLSPEAIGQIKKENTVILCSEFCLDQVQGIAMKNGEAKTIGKIRIEAVPAYNLVHKRDNGEPFHPKGVGNGYVVTLGDKKIYVAGDTENLPEMASLQDIDVAFLPMNLPYAMSPEMVAEAVSLFHPKIVYPYHMGDTDASQLVALLKDMPGCDVRIRKLQ